MKIYVYGLKCYLSLVCFVFLLSPTMTVPPSIVLALFFFQVVIVSVSSNRAKMKQEAAIQLPLVTHLVPMMILVQEPHFENLFNMLQVLSNLQRVSKLLSEIKTSSTNTLVICQ